MWFLLPAKPLGLSHVKKDLHPIRKICRIQSCTTKCILHHHEGWLEEKTMRKGLDKFRTWRHEEAAAWGTFLKTRAWQVEGTRFFYYVVSYGVSRRRTWFEVLLVKFRCIFFSIPTDCATVDTGRRLLSRSVWKVHTDPNLGLKFCCRRLLGPLVSDSNLSICWDVACPWDIRNPENVSGDGNDVVRNSAWKFAFFLPGGTLRKVALPLITSLSVRY